MKKIFLFLIFVFLSTDLVRYQATCIEKRIPFFLWPHVKCSFFPEINIIVADTDQLAHQGFCDANESEFKNTVIWFPSVSEATVFVNTNPGYGTVISDIQVVFLDRNWSVLDIKTMEKESGTAIAPAHTDSALEAIPALIGKLGLKKGKLSNFLIKKINNEYVCLRRKSTSK